MRRFLAACCLLFAFGGRCNPEDTPKVTVAAGSLSGAWSAISEGLVSCIRRGLPGVAVTSEPGLDGANAALVDSGRVELGLIHAAMARLALQGEYPFQTSHSRLRGISVIYTDSVFHFLINRKTGIRSIDDIRKKKYPLRLSVIYRGSLMEIASRALLQAYGLSYEDIESWGGKIYFRALRPSLELMREGRIDAVSVTVQYPQTLIREAARHHDLMLLAPSRDAIEQVNRKLGTYRAVIPGGSYPFQPDDLQTFSDVVVLVANANLSDEYAYQISRAIHDQLDYLRNVHRALSRLEPSLLPPRAHLPIHPGALRFFQEADLL